MEKHIRRGIHRDIYIIDNTMRDRHWGIKILWYK